MDPVLNEASPDDIAFPVGRMCSRSDYLRALSHPCSGLVCNPDADQERHGSSSPELHVTTSIPDSDVETALIDAGS